MIGEPKMKESAAKAPTGEQRRQLRWRISPEGLDRKSSQSASQGDQGCLGPHDEAEADRGEGREQHAGEPEGGVGEASRPSAGTALRGPAVGRWQTP